MDDAALSPRGGVPDRDAVLASFYRWGFSDLRSNATRGVLAEYLVGQALGVDFSRPRVEWDAWDLQTPGGTKIEVKSSAYVQAWAPPARPGQVRYSGLLARHWVDVSAQVGSFTETPDVRADVYVFALQTCHDPGVYDALDLAQWEFRVVPGATVRSWNQMSIGLTQLEARGFTAVSVADLPVAVTTATDLRNAKSRGTQRSG